MKIVFHELSIQFLHIKQHEIVTSNDLNQQYQLVIIRCYIAYHLCFIYSLTTEQQIQLYQYIHQYIINYYTHEYDILKELLLPLLDLILSNDLLAINTKAIILYDDILNCLYDLSAGYLDITGQIYQIKVKPSNTCALDYIYPLLNSLLSLTSQQIDDLVDIIKDIANNAYNQLYIATSELNYIEIIDLEIKKLCQYILANTMFKKQLQMIYNNLCHHILSLLTKHEFYELQYNSKYLHQETLHTIDLSDDIYLINKSIQLYLYNPRLICNSQEHFIQICQCYQKYIHQIINNNPMKLYQNMIQSAINYHLYYLYLLHIDLLDYLNEDIMLWTNDNKIQIDKYSTIIESLCLNLITISSNNLLLWCNYTFLNFFQLSSYMSQYHYNLATIFMIHNQPIDHQISISIPYLMKLCYKLIRTTYLPLYDSNLLTIKASSNIEHNMKQHYIQHFRCIICCVALYLSDFIHYLNQYDAIINTNQKRILFYKESQRLIQYIYHIYATINIYIAKSLLKQVKNYNLQALFYSLQMKIQAKIIRNCSLYNKFMLNKALHVSNLQIDVITTTNTCLSIYKHVNINVKFYSITTRIDLLLHILFYPIHIKKKIR